MHSSTSTLTFKASSLFPGSVPRADREGIGNVDDVASQVATFHGQHDCNMTKHKADYRIWVDTCLIKTLHRESDLLGADMASGLESGTSQSVDSFSTSRTALFSTHELLLQLQPLAPLQPR